MTRRPPPNLDDPWVLAVLERTPEGRKAIQRYQFSMRPGLSKATRRAERRIAERQARAVLDGLPPDEQSPEEDDP